MKQRHSYNHKPQTIFFFKERKIHKLCDIWNQMRSNADSQTTPPPDLRKHKDFPEDGTVLNPIQETD